MQLKGKQIFSELSTFFKNNEKLFPPKRRPAVECSAALPSRSSAKPRHKHWK